MREIVLRRIKFSSFLYLVVTISLAFGVVAGILLFIMSLFGGNVYANFGSIKFDGVAAGVINLVLFPAIIAFFDLFFGLIAFLPLKWILSMHGLNVKVDFKVLEQQVTSQTEENSEYNASTKEFLEDPLNQNEED